MKTTAIIRSAAIAAGGVLFFTSIRPRYLHWGASDADIARGMPLDARVPDPMLTSTMAITISAPPDEIWPWLAQMGEPPRAGYYSYTWIERLAGIDVVNADRVFPQFQTLHAGDALDKCGNMVVLAVDPCNHLVLGPAESIDVMRCTWAFGLYPTG